MTVTMQKIKGLEEKAAALAPEFPMWTDLRDTYLDAYEHAEDVPPDELKQKAMDFLTVQNDLLSFFITHSRNRDKWGEPHFWCASHGQLIQRLSLTQRAEYELWFFFAQYDPNVILHYPENLKKVGADFWEAMVQAVQISEHWRGGSEWFR